MICSTSNGVFFPSIQESLVNTHSNVPSSAFLSPQSIHKRYIYSTTATGLWWCISEEPTRTKQLDHTTQTIHFSC